MTAREITEALEKVACEHRGYWHDGSPFEGTLADACKEAMYIYASVNELEDNDISLESEYIHKNERILWYINARGYAEAMPEITEIIFDLMFRASLIDTRDKI